MSAFGHVEREAAKDAEIERLRAELAAKHEPADDWEARQAIAEAVAAERERCAQVVLRELSPELGEELAAAIRRGEP